MATVDSLNYEEIFFDLFSNKENLKNNNTRDPDINLFSNISSLNTKYYLPNEIQKNLKISHSKNFSVVHLNIRSRNKNFDNFRDLIQSLNVSFNVICLTETWSGAGAATQDKKWRGQG